MLKIQKNSNSYRISYSITVNGITRNVSSIKFYDENGVVVEENDGNLIRLNSNNEPLYAIGLDTDKEIKLKRKLNFDGEVFVMLHDKMFEKYWELYIPNELAGFKKTDRYLWENEFIVTVIDKYESETLNAEIEVYRHDLEVDKKLIELRADFAEIKGSYDLTIDRDITEDLKKLMKLKRDYDKELNRVRGLDLSKL